MDETAVVLAHIQELKKVTGLYMHPDQTAALDYLKRSSHPQATRFVRNLLADPKTVRRLKEELYWHIAGSGDKESVKAVLAMRHKRKLLPPLDERLADSQCLGEKTDSMGRVWCFFENALAGDVGDLWLAEKVNGKWKRPLFLGMSTKEPDWLRGPDNQPFGKMPKQLVEGEWFTALVGNPKLEADTDKDGLNDILETHLGTDPNKVDTDGDGDADQFDPCPNASSRGTLTDEQKVYVVAVEAVFHFENPRALAMLEPSTDLTPFEIPGRENWTVWNTPRKETIRSERWSLDRIGFSGFRKRCVSDESPIEWNKDRTEAKLGVSIFEMKDGCGYNVVVRKFGRNWVVVGVEFSFVT